MYSYLSRKFYLSQVVDFENSNKILQTIHGDTGLTIRTPQTYNLSVIFLNEGQSEAKVKSARKALVETTICHAKNTQQLDHFCAISDHYLILLCSSQVWCMELVRAGSKAFIMEQPNSCWLCVFPNRHMSYTPTLATLKIVPLFY